MSVTMGNAIRQLKLEISASDIDMPEQDVRLHFILKSKALLHHVRVTLFCSNAGPKWAG
jgi:hypothetical protein